MKAIRIHNYGGPEVLSYEDIPIPEPKAGEARIKLDAIGLNFIDIYQRTGLYPVQTPFTLGMEGAGVVDAIDNGVGEVQVGVIGNLKLFGEHFPVPLFAIIFDDPFSDRLPVLQF
jgi:NADPH:quinone reductase